MQCLNRFNKRMSLSGGSLRNESIFNTRELLKETFADDPSFVPDIYFFDASEAGLRYIAEQLRKKGTLIYFEPERDNEQKKLLKGVELSDIVKFSHERISDISFTEQYKDTLDEKSIGANSKLLISP